MNHHTPRHDASEVAALLAREIQRLSESILGPRNKAKSTANEWRWGTNGSLSVAVNGPKRGRWYSHEAGSGGDALELVKVHITSNTRDAIEWALAWLGAAPISTPAPVLLHRNPAPPAIDDDAGERIEAALRIWRETVPLADTLAEAYLQHRGIAALEGIEDLKFHPNCPAGRGERRPAMVALLRDIITNEACGVHRTFLRADGLGKDDLGKKMLGRAKGAVVKLTDDADVTHGLGLAEGIENALTLASYGWWPIWAAGSAGAIRNFPVLDGLEALTIFSDADDAGAGAGAARECATRWRAANKLVEIHHPPAGRDWNDVAREIAA